MATFTEPYSYADYAAFLAAGWVEFTPPLHTAFSFPSGRFTWDMGSQVVPDLSAAQHTHVFPGKFAGNATAGGVFFDIPHTAIHHSHSSIVLGALSLTLDSGVLFSISYEVSFGTVTVNADATVVAAGTSYSWTDSATGLADTGGNITPYITRTGSVLSFGSLEHGIFMTTTWPFTTETVNLAFFSAVSQTHISTASHPVISLDYSSWDYTPDHVYYTPNITGVAKGTSQRFTQPKSTI